ncbi:MAG: hypothetical protein ACW99G_20370 [Candidatus Thorarchaeota archaeon]|jgi:hypothetical protein
MLTLFVIGSGEGNADIEKTIASFSGLSVDHKVISVTGWREINQYKDKDEWFGIFWDNECIDKDLSEFIPTYLSFRNLELLILYKKMGVTEATWRDRFFRSHIHLLNGYRPMCMRRWLNKEVVLDGWVLEHEYPN